MGLLLRAVDVAGPLRWRWLLTDAETGAPLADHDVDLAAESDAVARFRDLYRYARQFAVPDRRVGDGARIVAEAGAWAGQALLGAAVGAAIKAAARTEPVTVLVTEFSGLLESVSCEFGVDSGRMRSLSGYTKSSS